MKRALLVLVVATPVTLSGAPAVAKDEPPRIHVSASCVPATKPGRIRCRAVLELPLDRATQEKLSWAEVRFTAGDAAITPLRGRLGPLDAEMRDDARMTWAFSVAASATGVHTFTLGFVATVVPVVGKAGVPQTLERTLEVAARVEP